MNKAAKVLLIYSAAFAVFITVSPVITTPTSQTIVTQLFLLPIALFLMVTFIGSFRRDATNISLPIGKSHILISLVVLIALLGLGFMSISNADKARNTEPNQGWVSQTAPTDSISLTTTVSPIPTPELKKVVIDSKGIGFVNIRETASTASEVIGKADDGDEFGVYEEVSGWYKVEIEDGKFGYISKNYTKEVQ